MKLKRLRAAFLLTLFAFESFWPTVSLALTEGYVQPEFASFEEMGASELVDVMTGDFTYNIPLLNVPSPEGGFQMPLSYHAGIQMDEESSWVGLGWSLNPGVMERQASVYPDDYDGSQTITDYVNAPSLSGDGYRENVLGFHNEYNSLTGESHGFDFGHIYHYSKSEATGVGVSVLGVSYNYDKQGRWGFDGKECFMGLIEVGMYAASYGTFGPMGEVFTTGVGIMNAAVAVTNMASGANKPRSTTEHLGNHYHQETEYYKVGPVGHGVRYKWYVTGSTSYQTQGVLYLGNASKYTNSTNLSPNDFGGELVFNGGGWGSAGSASQPKSFSSQLYHDMYVHYDGNAYATQFNPNSIAYDNFTVKAPGASGAIKPHRLDAGSFSNPVYGSTHFGYSLTSFLRNKTNTVNGYKVPFKYEGDMSNKYDYPVTYANGNVSTQFATDWNYQNSNFFQVSLNQTQILNEDVLNGSSKVGQEANRNDLSLSNSKLVHSNNINWYSNYEIINNQADAYFMNCGINRSTFPVNGIGGFSVTKENGLTYHFSLPVYNKTEYKKVKKDGVDFYVETNHNPYAIMWLLTGITGADFVDRGTIGQIDDADWGYWVKLDYGMYNNNYLWRSPYWGWETSPDGAVKKFTKGFKQTYYLNTIRTRTHTAFFVKDEKNDGKSYYETNGDGRENPSNANEPADATPSAISNSLRLESIYLLKNADYDNIVSTLQTKWNFNYNNATNFAWAWDWNNPQNFNIDNISANVILSGDMNSSLINFLYNNQQARIKFNYTYDLCAYTTNSSPYSPSYSAWQGYGPPSQYRTGKLTLGSIELQSKSYTKIQPTYIFDYNAGNIGYDNPYYSVSTKDDLGYFKPEYSNSGALPRNPGPEGDQWSLKKITTPLGAEISIEYERDTYSWVNGMSWGYTPLKIPGINIAQNITSYRVYVDTRFGDLNKFMKLNTVGYIKAPQYTTSSGTIPEQLFIFNVSAISSSGTYFDFTSTNSAVSTLCNDIANNPYAASAEIGMFTGNSALNPKYGGNLRVKALSVTDEFGNKYGRRYDYHNSGVASSEPISNRIADYEFYRFYDHPYTPIIYGEVTVSNGRYNGTAFETNTKTKYKFVTPDKDMLTVDRGTLYNNVDTTNYTFKFGPYHAVYNGGTHKAVTGYSGISRDFMARSGHILITDNTHQIGNIKEVTNYNARNEVISQSTFQYGTPSTPNMAKYGETNFLFEKFVEPIGTTTNNALWAYRLIQTTKIKNLYTLQSVKNNVGGIMSETSIQEWDPQTGKPVKVLNTIGGPNGEKFLSEYIPAYKKYPEMGSKALNPDFKNVMTQNAQEKQWVEVATSAGTSFKLLSSSATTWSKNMRYRQHDQSTGLYVSQPLTQTSTFIPPYLPEKEYVWRSKVDKDGTIKPSDYVDFNWSASSQDAHWIKTSEATLYSPYSKLLEAVDVNNTKISSKYTDNGSYPTASLKGVGYGEWCFSGAEDKGKGNETNYFGGEVQETQYRYYDASGTFAHTGNYSLKVPGNGNGFHFRGDFGANADFKPSKTYRASVWMHQSNYTGGLYYELRSSVGIVTSSGVVIPTNSVKEKYGSWYLLNFDFTLPAAASVPGTNPYLIIGCYNPNTSSSNYIYFDDFRVQPIGASYMASVTDTKTGRVVAELDAENIATKYYYNDAGYLIKTEKETKNGFVKISEHEIHYKRP